MGHHEANDELVRSVLDRLMVVESEPSARAGADVELRSTLARLREDVRRDLEWLLNTKRALDTPLEELGPLETSLWTYGVPDFTNLSVRAAGQRGFLDTIKTAIELFEPRLSEVSVTLGSTGQQPQSQNYEITAMLKVEPKPVAVKFDSRLELTTKTFVVQDS